MSKQLSSLPLILAVILCLAGLALGQETTGNLRGTVKDQNGAVVSGATVTAKGPQRSFTTTTNEDGQFEFNGQLPPDNYTISATAPGFNDAMRTDVPVLLGKTIQVNIDLSVSGTSATVNVTTNQEPLVDVTST
jgi:flagellar hook assembly protein FlgD